MTTSITLPDTQVVEVTESRRVMFMQSLSLLQHIAWRILNVHGKRNDERVVICIQVDSEWRKVVDLLMPGENWQAVRDRDKEPVAVGSANWDLCRLVAKRHPELAEATMRVPSEGMVKVLVLSDTGATIYQIEPKVRSSSLN